MGKLHNIIYIKETVLTLLEEAIRDNISNSKVKSIFISSKRQKPNASLYKDDMYKRSSGYPGLPGGRIPS